MGGFYSSLALSSFSNHATLIVWVPFK